jgi:uncharacterized protein (DUF302 family)
MKKLLGILFIGIFSFVSGHDIQLLSIDNKDGKITPKTIEDEFKNAGFYISDNRDMNGPFTKQFQNTDFKVYNLFTTHHIKSVQNLAKQYPRIGLFTPMSMSIYTKKGEDKLYVSSLTLDAMSKITGIPKENKDLQNIVKMTKDTLLKAMPKAKLEKLPYEPSATPKELITKMHVKLKSKEWASESDSLIEEFEANLEMNGFVQAGFNDINYYFKESGDKYFDIFVSESICKLPVIYTVAKTRPEAGAFAPCSISIYKKSSDDFLYIEYPNVYNWIASLDMDNKEGIKELIEAQAKMEVVLYNLKTDYEK